MDRYPCNRVRRIDPAGRSYLTGALPLMSLVYVHFMPEHNSLGRYDRLWIYGEGQDLPFLSSVSEKPPSYQSRFFLPEEVLDRDSESGAGETDLGVFIRLLSDSSRTH
jgi:hypothetical protein